MPSKVFNSIANKIWRRDVYLFELGQERYQVQLPILPYHVSLFSCYRLILDWCLEESGGSDETDECGKCEGSDESKDESDKSDESDEEVKE